MTRSVNFGVEVVSLSSWRAWIEIADWHTVCRLVPEVALLMESVD